MKRAFSLVELLVVIAILAILAGILFPVFSRVRENGRRAACQSNLKQIGYGLIQYSQDYDEILVADWYGTNTTIGPSDTLPPGSPMGVSYKWEDAAFPYVKNEQVFNCPSAISDAAAPYHYYKTLTQPQPYGQLGSYIIVHGYGPTTLASDPINGFAQCPNNSCTPPVSHPLSDDLVNLSQAVVPSKTAWVLDGDGQFFAEVDKATGELGNIEDRHLSTIVVLFLDGHVKSTRKDDLMRLNAKGVMSMVTVQDD